MRSIAQLSVVLWPLLLSSAAEAQALEQTVIRGFEAYCIENSDDLGRTAQQLASLDNNPINHPAAAMLLNGIPGKVWMLALDDTKLFLAITDNGTCTVFSKTASAKTVKNIFLETFRTAKLQSEDIGSQIEEVFSLTQADRSGGPDHHLLVLMNSPKVATELGIIINGISEEAARQRGIKINNWP